ncbi:MAG: hypothetical protein IJX99_08965 [Clostridia bacterium]|nr:hypothetical protein [Clostridia bacterium]
MLYALIDCGTKQRFNKISSEEILGEVKITTPKIREKNENVLVRKILKKINEHNVENVILSKEMINNNNLCRRLEDSKKYIITGRRMGKVLLTKFINEISKYTRYSKEKMNILLLMNEYSLENIDLIEWISKDIKELNLISRNYTKYEKTSLKLFEQYGYLINLYNTDTEKDFRRSNLVINLDFSEEEIQKIKMPKNSILVSLNNKVSTVKHGFNGIIINDVDIMYGNCDNKFRYRDLAICEAKIYRPLRKLKENERIFNSEKYMINGYMGIKGKITVEEFEKIGRSFS